MLFHTWLMGRTSTLILGVELLWLVMIAYTTSDGARFFLVDDVLFFLGGVVIIGIWVVGVVGSLIRYPGHRIRYMFSLAWPLWWVREPYVLAAALVLWATPLAFLTRLAVSAPFVRGAAERVLAAGTPPSQLNNRVIGLFLVSDVSRSGDAVRFRTGPCNLFDDCGFAYGPKGMPSVEGRYRYYHLWGPWWQWYRHF